MASTDPGSLERLHDIVVPPPVSWWPPAPAWYALAALVLFLGAAVAWLLVARWHRNRYRRAALAELARIDARSPRAVAQLAELVKRVALAAFPRDRVASLTGDAWLAFLNATANTSDFATAPGSLLGGAEYARDTALESTAARLFDIVRHWITHHKC